MKLLRRKTLVCLFFLLCVISPVVAPSHAADLVIAENGASPYQIVIPDRAADEVVDRWLVANAKLVQSAFQKNGFEVAVARESARAADKPGIYIGATEFAKKNKVEVNTDDWSYVWKAVGRDLIIVGSDRKDAGVSRTTGQLALLGSVKGTLDFLHDYVQVRFLFFNFAIDATLATSLDGGMPVQDTRSIAFLPTQRIAIPTDLDLRKTPLLNARQVSFLDTENFYTIAMNYFPLMKSTWSMPVDIHWDQVVPLDKYGESHPEYFALLPSNKRASVTTADYQPRNYAGQTALDITNPAVLNLMYLEAEKQIKRQMQEGAKSQWILFFPLDEYLLSRCNCDRCNKFFGMTAKTYDEVKARGASGKMWQIYFLVTERLRKNYPLAKIIIWDYQEHTLDSKVVQSIPENVVPKLQFGVLRDFDRLKGIDIPGGIVGLEETFTGFGLNGPYTPERTPEYAAKIAQAVVQHKVRWTSRDGSIGYSRGLSAPAYYVYGRMLDDPSADYNVLTNEFYAAAFGNVSWQMTEFFNLLYRQIGLYSDFFGIQGPAVGDRYARGFSNFNKWNHQSIYTVDFIAKANALLSDAEQKTTDPDVKARLGLIRIEFDYVSELGKIFALQDAWTLNPTPGNLDVLLNAVDGWQGQLKTLAGGTGSSNMKPLTDWPQMRPFNDHTYSHAALHYSTYQNGGWRDTAIGWDIEAIRDGALTQSGQIPVAAPTGTLDINSNAWKQAPAQVLRRSSDMPANYSRTTFKVLRDEKNLYVRFDSRIDNKQYMDGMLAPTAERDVLKQEYVELSVQPKAGGKIYRFAANPTKGVRYDATLGPAEDLSWNGQWQYDYQVSLGTDSQPYPVWTAWFKIPFTDFGIPLPAEEKPWKFNAARMQGEGLGYLAWQGGRANTANLNSMGEIKFR